MGLDPSGRELDPAMPRYALTHEDLDDLVAYLRKLGHDLDPGLTDQEIVVGTILPPSPSMGPMSRAVASVLAAYFAEVNDRGGIFGRRVSLKSEAAPEAASERADAARGFVQRQEVFALVAPFIAGDEGPITEAARDQKVPIVGPFTLFPQVGHPLNRYVFYLQAGLADQGKALALFASRRPGVSSPSAAILFPVSDELSRTSAEAIRAECQRLAWSRIELLAVARGAGLDELVGRMVADRPEVVFDLRSEGREVEFLDAAGSRAWEPLLLIPGALAGKDILRLPPRYQHRLFLSFPTLPLDSSRAGAAEYDRLAVAHQLPGSHRSTQVAALTSARIFVEAMTSAGRAASREALIEQLEHVFQQPTGLSPPITFGPNRRIGARGAYIVEVDPENARLVPVSGFIEPMSP
jgi:ABC-type branched-subunit amino acid transport system substrate-binding protein